MKKINRRQFVTASTAAGALPLAALGAHGADAPAGGRDYYELRQYSIDNEKQKAGFDLFFREAAIPALNQIGHHRGGVFYAKDQLSPIYVLLRHRTLDSFVAWKEQVMALENFRTKGEAFLNAPRETPAYNRFESSLFIAF